MFQYWCVPDLLLSWASMGRQQTPVQRMKLSVTHGCRWTEAFGDYVNGEPGQPLLVSMLLYLHDQWPRDWGAETLFLDDEVSAAHILLRQQEGALIPACMSGRPSRGSVTRVAAA